MDSERLLVELDKSKSLPTGREQIQHPSTVSGSNTNASLYRGITSSKQTVHAGPNSSSGASKRMSSSITPGTDASSWHSTINSRSPLTEKPDIVIKGTCITSMPTEVEVSVGSVESTAVEDWGRTFIASYVAIAIYGSTIFQTVYYFVHYEKDKLVWKALVATVFALDTTTAGLFVYCIYHYLVSVRNLPLNMDVQPQFVTIICSSVLFLTENFQWAYVAECILSMLQIFIVQCFFINSISTLRAPVLITLSLVLLALLSLGSAIAITALHSPTPQFGVATNSSAFPYLFMIERGSALACDIGIVVSLCWLLSGRKLNIRTPLNGESHERSVRSVRVSALMKLVILVTVERGLLLVIVQVGETVAYAMRPHSLFFLPLHMISVRVYCASLLATLNARKLIAAKAETQEPDIDQRRAATTAPASIYRATLPVDTQTTYAQHAREGNMGCDVVSFGLSGPKSELLHPDSQSQTILITTHTRSRSLQYMPNGQEGKTEYV